MSMPVLKRVYGPIVAWSLSVVIAGCGNLAGRASDDWTHTYPLAAGGEVEIANSNGRIDVEAVDGSTLEVRAERIAKAATDAGAAELLPRIKITETAKPDHVTIQTEKLGGMMIGANFEIRYHVKAPRRAFVHVSNTNGQVSIAGMAGKITAATTNGTVALDLASIPDAVTATTTNGAVTVTLPDDAKADLTATVTNGAISVTGLKLETTEQSRRRVEGKINGGGPRLEVHTTNGAVRVRGKSAASS